jgi:mono/diheme cytochrome c family protein
MGRVLRLSLAAGIAGLVAATISLPRDAGAEVIQQRGQTPPVPVGPRPNAGPPDRPPVDPAAADRGRAIYGVECITCHGASARGTSTAPSLIRSLTVLNDRYGTLLGPFFKSPGTGHPMQSGRASATLTATDVVDLMHFLRQRINDTLRGSDQFDVKDILTGDPKAGEAYFSGEGKCTACHSTTGDLAGIATRLPAPVDLQQRMLFPTRRATKAGPPTRSEVTVTVTPASGQTLNGVLVVEDDFFVTLRDQSGATRVVRKGPDVKVVTTDGLQTHRDLLDRISDKNIHDLVAYFVRLK